MIECGKWSMERTLLKEAFLSVDGRFDSKELLDVECIIGMSLIGRSQTVNMVALLISRILLADGSYQYGFLSSGVFQPIPKRRKAVGKHGFLFVANRDVRRNTSTQTR